MPNKKTIGILGGMGPLASAHLYQQIITAAQTVYHAEQDSDFPPMVIYNLPLTGFDETGFTDPPAVEQQLIAGVRKLADAGSDCIIIACNTVHFFYQAMQAAVPVPIISMIDETVRAVQGVGCHTVGLLSSESTAQLGIYHAALAKAGVATVSVAAEQQRMINRIILNVMSGRHGCVDTTWLKASISYLAGQGAEAIILGCTELPLAISQPDVPIPLFDATKIIAESALVFSVR